MVAVAALAVAAAVVLEEEVVLREVDLVVLVAATAAPAMVPAAIDAATATGMEVARGIRVDALGILLLAAVPRSPRTEAMTTRLAMTTTTTTHRMAAAGIAASIPVLLTLEVPPFSRGKRMAQ